MEYVFSDVNEALPVMMQRMLHTQDGMVFERDSRNGPVFESVSPVTTTFLYPRRRVLFDGARDANPFFHLFEAIWMLAGRNDVAWLAQFNKQMMEYSDDDKTIAGSNYGMRWNYVLEKVLDELKGNRQTRRAYVPIFETDDVHRMAEGTKDLPCNVGVHFLVRDGRLDMTVFNRSNDMLLGAYGANYVHFGFFQEYVAQILRLEVGRYNQISSCFHLYRDFPVTKRLLSKGVGYDNPYNIGTGMRPSPIFVLNVPHDIWQRCATTFINIYTSPDPYIVDGFKGYMFADPFFQHIAAPMFDAWAAMIRERNYEKAMEATSGIRAIDWQTAAVLWISRRQAERTRKAASEDASNNGRLARGDSQAGPGGTSAT